MIRRKYQTLKGSLNERSRRIWAVTEAQALGYGGRSLVARATGISRSTIIRGTREVRRKSVVAENRVRRQGAGRKRATAIDPSLSTAIEQLVDPLSRGDPESPLRWTCKSTRQLATELTAKGHPGIWVDTKKKELVGNFKNSGREWRPRGDPQKVGVHQQELARAAAADVCHHCEVDRRQANVHIRPHRSCSASLNVSQSLRTGKTGPIQS